MWYCIYYEFNQCWFSAISPLSVPLQTSTVAVCADLFVLCTVELCDITITTVHALQSLIKQWDIKTKNLLSGDLYDVITSCGAA